MSFEKGLPQTALKKWTSISNLGNDFLLKIKYFCGFQTYLAEEEIRKPSAIFVTTDDEVYAIGHNNSDNLLALEDDDFAKTVDLTEPRKIKSLSGMKIKQLTVSERFGAALTEDGKLLYWGMDMEMLRFEEADKKYLQKPHKPNAELDVAMMTCAGHSITYVTKDGELFLWGCLTIFYTVFYNFEQLHKPDGAVFKSITSGWYHVALLDDQGRAWTLGNDSVGELGYSYGSVHPRQVELPGKCTKVECGAYSTLFLLENGDVYACGNNLQLDHLCVGKEGHIFKPLRVLLDDPITDIMVAYNWSGSHWQSRFTAFSSKGEYFKWGEDSKEKVPSKVPGVNSLTEMYVDFKTPQAYGDVIRTARDVDQGVIPLMLPSDVSQTKPKPADTNAAQSSTDAALKKPNSDQSIGTPSGEFGGSPPLNPNITESKQKIPGISVTLGGSAAQESKATDERKIVPSKPEPVPHSILSEWSLFQSVDESFIKQITHFTVFSAYDIYISDVRLGSFVVTKDDNVYSFGFNTNEKLLGLSGQAAEGYEVETPTKVDNLSGKKMKKIVISRYQGVALSGDGLVFVWNRNSPPTLLKIEEGTTVDVACGPKFFLVLTSGSTIYLNGEIGSEVVENKKISIPSGVEVKNIVCGDSHGAFASTDGDAYTFGNGIKGQLGYEQNPEPSYVAKKVTLPQPCTKIACGVSSTIFLLKNGDIHACGANSYFDRLGVGHEKIVFLPEKVVMSDRAVDISASVKQLENHLRVSMFTVKTLTKGFFKWGTQFVASKFELWDVSTMLEAFRGQAIPQSMSLVHLDSQDDDSHELQPAKPNQKESSKSEDQGEKTPPNDGGTMYLVDKQSEEEKDESNITKKPSIENKQGDPSSLTSESAGQDEKRPTEDGGMESVQEVTKNEESKKNESHDVKKPTVENENSETPSSTLYSEGQDGKRPTEDGGSVPTESVQEVTKNEEGKKDENQDVKKPTAENEKPDSSYPMFVTESNGKATPNPSDVVKTTTTNVGEPAKNGVVDKNTLGDNILGEQLYSDLTIKLSNGKIPVHKILLYTKSPFFRQALSGNDNIEELDLSSYKPKSVLALLKHIYGVPIGENASIDDAADFHEFARKNGTSSVLELSKLLLYSSTLYDVIATHLRQKGIESKEKILEAILPSKAFP